MVEAVLWAGQRALLVELGSLAEMVSLRRHLEQTPLEGQREIIGVARTLLVDFRSRRQAQAGLRQLRKVRPRPQKPQEVQEIRVEVNYGGNGLAEAAEDLGLSPESLIDWHTSTRWVPVFAAEAPGFIRCVPEELLRRRRPRKSVALPVPRIEPRKHTPDHAVLVAGEYSAICPTAGSGSGAGRWHLLGTSQPPRSSLWTPMSVRAESEHSFAEEHHIRSAVHIRYKAVPERLRLSPTTEDPRLADPDLPRDSAETADTVLEVLAAGSQTLIQDMGRPGWGDCGVPRSGAVDAAALRQANQLVGNEDSASGFEVLRGGLRLRARQTTVLAVTGADVDITVRTEDIALRSNMALSGTGDTGLGAGASTEREVPLRAPFWLFPGEELVLSAPRRGIRSYVAVSGGLAADSVLGSTATDTVSGLGPAPVRDGQSFGLVGASSRFVGIADVARTPLPPAAAESPADVSAEESAEPLIASPAVLRCTPGPHAEQLNGPRGRPLQAMESQLWNVPADAGRAGVFLRGEPHSTGPTPAVPSGGTLDQEPVPRGAVLLLSSGQLRLCLADHPVTSAYPVIGVIVREDLGLAAQLPAGSTVRFVGADPETLLPLA